MNDWIRSTIKSLHNEVVGEDVAHPIIRRILAYAIDYLAYAVFGGVLTFILYQFDAYTYQRLLVLLLPSTVVYFTWGASKYSNGQTLGKKVFRIQVANENGEPVNVLTAFLRGILVTLMTSSLSLVVILQSYYEVTDITFMIVRSLFICLLIGVFYFGVTKLNRQCLHDLITSTQVIERPSNVKTEKRLTPGLLLGYAALIVIALMKVWIW